MLMPGEALKALNWEITLREPEPAPEPEPEALREEPEVEWRTEERRAAADAVAALVPRKPGPELSVEGA